MITTLATLLLALIPQGDIVADDVDLIELNHYYDGCGQPIFSQFIFWDWHPRLGTHVVRAWTMADTTRTANGVLVCRGNTPLIGNRPVPTAAGWRLIYTDRATGHTLRQITARAFRETWTQHDPEVTDRDRLPTADRTPLSRPRRSAPPK